MGKDKNVNRNIKYFEIKMKMQFIKIFLDTMKAVLRKKRITLNIYIRRLKIIEIKMPTDQMENRKSLWKINKSKKLVLLRINKIGRLTK